MLVMDYKNNHKINAMKTNLSSKVLMLIALAFLAVVSCTKESALTNMSSLPPDDTSKVTPLGFIEDYGFINEDANGVLNAGPMEMRVGISALPNSLKGNSGSLTGAVAQITSYFYADKDGFLPAGEYSFSTSGSKTAFTFDRAVIEGNFSSGGYSYHTDKISSGIINVQQDGVHYVFDFNVDLESGMTFKGTFNGQMNYSAGGYDE
jgi:hypothetical protein